MLEQFVTVFLDLLYFYAGAGAIFALVFVIFGLQRIDSQAAGAGWGFRLLVFPGSIAFWPLLLRRWVSGIQDPPEEGNPHR